MAKKSTRKRSVRTRVAELAGELSKGEIEDAERLAEGAMEFVEGALAEPIVVAVMGQTGVGKSSLINALFGSELATDPTRPCTKQPELVEHVLASGQKLQFWDLPGIGEGEAVDLRYIEIYREKLRSADVCLWAVNADSRAVGTERILVDTVLDGLEEAVRSKIVVVLTKADLIGDGPWRLGLFRRHAEFKRPFEDKTLDSKARYFEEELVADRLSARSVLVTTSPVAIRDPRFVVNGDEVTLDGHLSSEEHERLSAIAKPSDRDLLDRFRELSKVVVCSANYRHNLVAVLEQVVARADDRAIIRIGEVIEPAEIEFLLQAQALEQRNFVVVDARGKKGGPESLVDIARQFD